MSLNEKLSKGSSMDLVTNKLKKTNVPKTVDTILADGSLEQNSVSSKEVVPHVDHSASTSEIVARPESVQVVPSLLPGNGSVDGPSPLGLVAGSSSDDNMIWSPEKVPPVQTSMSPIPTQNSPSLEVVDCVLALPADFPSRLVNSIQPSNLLLATKNTLTLSPTNFNPLSPLSKITPPVPQIQNQQKQISQITTPIKKNP